VDNFPEDETLAFNVGEIYFKQGETDKAIEYFQLAVKIKESWAPPHRQLGYAYLNKGKYKLAVDCLKKFVELVPDDPQAENIKNLIPKLEELIKDN
jgi:tetratricopeptide (TPR) repeat protein